MSLKTGLKILNFLTSQGEGAGLVTIAEALNLPRSTCHRVLSELVEGVMLDNCRTTAGIF